MRGHEKAPSAGTTNHRIVGAGRVLLGFLAAALSAVALMPAAASATTNHFYIEDFGSVAQPSFSVPTAVAVDQSTGDVLVVDPEASTLSRYKPDGTPDDFSALGTNVIDGVGPEDETPQGGLTFPFNEEVRRQAIQVAVDNSGSATDGNIYLATGTLGEPHLVDIFASSGKYLGQLTEFKEGANATGSPTNFEGRACGVAVALNGVVYVGDRNGYIHKYAPSGPFPTTADNVANFTSFLAPCSLAVGVGPTAGFLFVAEGPEASASDLVKMDASTGEVKYLVAKSVTSVTVDPTTGDIYAAKKVEFENNKSKQEGGWAHLDASGSLGPVLESAIPSVDENKPGAGIAVNGATHRLLVSEAGHSELRVFGPLQTAADVALRPAIEVSATRARLRGTVNPGGAAITACEFEYGTVESGTFSESAPCEESVPTDTSTHTVSALATGLLPGVEYQYRLAAANAERTSTSAVGTFRVLQRVITAGPTSVSTGSAKANGLVRLEGEELIECQFEYGLDVAYGLTAPCSQAPATVPADFAVHAVSGQLSGLEEFAVYHYRLSFATAAGTFTGKDELFRTLGPTGLSDNRRYEQVSPVDKNHSDIMPIQSVASTNGDRLVTTSAGAFAGAPTALLVGTQYLSARGPNGWKTESITLPGGQIATNIGYQAFSDDLSKGVIEWPDDTQLGPHDPNAIRGRNLYLHDAGTGAFSLVNGTESAVSFSSVVAGSSDFSHLAMTVSAALTPEAHLTDCAVEKSGDVPFCAYEWVNGTLRLASIVNGTPVEGKVGGFSVGNPCAYDHAMSGDGARLFFSSPPNETPPPNVVQPKLYARENGTTTTAIGASERTLPGGVSGKAVNYQNAEVAHGNRVIFTTANTLVNADDNETNDLYLYDYTKPAGERLTLISADQDPNAPNGAEVDGPSGCGGVVGASEDLKRVYFIAQHQIVPGESETAGPKLFLWDDTGATPTVSYIATLEESDNRVWNAALQQGAFSRNARLSSNARYLAFPTRAKLTDFDNEGRMEIYRYDAVSGSLECASCSADASPAEGAVSFEQTQAVGGFVSATAVYTHVSTAVSDSGQVFFQTPRGLVPEDSNGKLDVYEYENGRLSLISSGEGAGDSYFLDASPSGNDVFFLTSDRLVGWDTDENADAYDARVNGGFPEPPLSGPACVGDSCQPAPNSPDDATPASSSFEGAGNVTEARHSRCAKGKVRRQGRCVKRRKHAKKHAHHQRTATRSHG